MKSLINLKRTVYANLKPRQLRRGFSLFVNIRLDAWNGEFYGEFFDFFFDGFELGRVFGEIVFGAGFFADFASYNCNGLKHMLFIEYSRHEKA